MRYKTVVYIYCEGISYVVVYNFYCFFTEKNIPKVKLKETKNDICGIVNAHKWHVQMVPQKVSRVIIHICIRRSYSDNN